MDSEQFTNKVYSVIDSCTSREQVGNAERYLGVALDYYMKNYGSIGYVTLMVNGMFRLGLRLGGIQYTDVK